MKEYQPVILRIPSPSAAFAVIGDVYSCPWCREEMTNGIQPTHGRLCGCSACLNSFVFDAGIFRKLTRVEISELHSHPEYQAVKDRMEKRFHDRGWWG